MNRSIVITEVQIMSVMEQMCAESLDPETFEMWDQVARVLREIRTELVEAKMVEPVAAESHGCHGGDGATISRLDELESENAALKYSLQLDEDLIGKIQQIIGVLANRPTQFITPPPAILEWQPIETAPRDGTKILLCRAGLNEAGEDLGIWWACKGFWSGKWNNWNDGCEPCGLAKPTHWMPLPAAPKKEGKS